MNTSIPQIKDLTYRVTTGKGPDGTEAVGVVFSTNSLTAADANFGTGFGPLSSLSKVTGQYPTSFDDSHAPIDYGQLVKQYPIFYISANFPDGGACSSSTSAGSDIAATTTNGKAAAGKIDFGKSMSTIQLSK